MKKKSIVLCAVVVAACMGGGCTVVSANRVFPKLAWYWSTDAKEQRRENEAEKQYHQSKAPEP